MRLISHRGNTNGRIPERENSKEYIIEALDKGYDVEVDIWYSYKDSEFSWYLGHDEPIYKIDIKDLLSYYKMLWFHCKNIDALYQMTKLKTNARKYEIYNDLNYFWHQTDDFTLTSKEFIWTYPKQYLTDRSICVLPEIGTSGDVGKCYGICSDFIEKILIDDDGFIQFE